jgi:hypothetical protein
MKWINLEQVAIAFDQFINTFVYFPKDGFGYADETLSARSWRLRHDYKFYKIIDLIFFWQPQHCLNSYLSEMYRKQLPKEYSI